MPCLHLWRRKMGQSITMFHCSLWPNFYQHSAMHAWGQFRLSYLPLINFFPHVGKEISGHSGGLTNHPYVRKSTRDTPLGQILWPTTSRTSTSMISILHIRMIVEPFSSDWIGVENPWSGVTIDLAALQNIVCSVLRVPTTQCQLNVDLRWRLDCNSKRNMLAFIHYRFHLELLSLGW